MPATRGLKHPFACAALAIVAMWAVASAHARADVTVLQLDIQGAIGPGVAEYVVNGLNEARARQAQLVILRMDTPGGLDASMRDIIRAILASPVPVAVWVGPSGARAASAGTYILYASHVAAMAPGANLGAATPVRIGGSQPSRPSAKGSKPAGGEGGAMHRKMVNDAAAYIRGLAEMRGRNAQWAEQAVRRAASLTAREALERHVIDLMAESPAGLLRKLDGRTLTAAGQARTLRLKHATVTVLHPGWRSRLLGIITDPNVAYVLMLLGIYGLFFEMANPGFVLPGVVGGICLLLALFAWHVLPVNFAGAALIALGIAFMVAEAFAPSFGALGLGGIVAFIVGSVMLMDTGSPEFALSLSLIVGVALASAVFLIFVIGMALKARRRPVVSGSEDMLGARGEVIEDLAPAGRIRIQGEIWKARADAPVPKGAHVRVTGIRGLTLDVRPDTPASKEEPS